MQVLLRSKVGLYPSLHSSTAVDLGATPVYRTLPFETMTTPDITEVGRVPRSSGLHSIRKELKIKWLLPWVYAAKVMLTFMVSRWSSANNVGSCDTDIDIFSSYHSRYCSHESTQFVGVTLNIGIVPRKIISSSNYHSILYSRVKAPTKMRWSLRKGMLYHSEPRNTNESTHLSHELHSNVNTVINSGQQYQKIFRSWWYCRECN